MEQKMTKLEITQIATALMIQHGLIQSGWKFKLDRAKRRFGCCHYTRRQITMSLPLNEIRTIENITNTILHEIAHALVGYEAGHGPVWKARAIAIGCNGERCGSDVTLPKRWIGTCPNGHTIGRHRRTNTNGACLKCCNAFNGGRYSEKYVWSWKKQSI